MSYLRDFSHSFRTLTSTRPEKKAVPTQFLKPLFREFGGLSGKRTVRDMMHGNVKFRQESGLRDIRRNLRAAKQDAPIATGLEAGNLALTTAVTGEQEKLAEQQKQSIEEQTAALKKIRDAIEAYPEEAIRAFYGGSM